MKRVMVVIPKDIERELGVEDVPLWWTYWTPIGDECMVGYLTNDGLIIEETSSWIAFLKLMDLNPHLEQFKLGNSDEEPEEVLLIDKRTRDAFIVSFMELARYVEQISEQLTNR